MTDADDEPPRPSRWPLLLAAAITVASVGAAAVIMWQAFQGADDTTPRLATATAARDLRATLSSVPLDDATGAPLEVCPGGEELLADVAAALGDETWRRLVADGEVTTTASPVGAPPAALVECLASRDEEELRIVLSAAPAAAISAVRAEQPSAWEDLGSTNGGAYSGRCGRDECVVLWSDDELLALIGVEGPAAERLDARQVQGVLAAALPTVVAGLTT